MTRHFSLPTVLRMVPNGLLKEFFERMQVQLLCLDWKHLGKRQIEPLLATIGWLPPEDRARIEATLSSIYELACDTGWQTILEMARQVGEEQLLLERLAQACPYSRAMRVWLDHPALFQTAATMHQVEGLSRWRKRTGLPTVTPRITDESRRELASALSHCLRREEGRGRHCTVDYLRRSDGADLFVAYSDDYMHAMLVHDQHGRLKPCSYQPTFEIVYAYHQQQGTLELFARVMPRMKPILEDIFGQVILGTDLSQGSQRLPWDLNRLKDRYFCLETDPQDEVKASICKLRLEVPHYGRVTVEPRNRERKDIFEVIDDCLNDQRVDWNDIQISLATFRFQFQNRTTRKPDTLTFDVSAPDHCTIKSRLPDRVALTQKYLRRWRIACA